MAKNIKGITVEIGGDTTKLGKAIQGVDKDTRALQKELRGVNTLLKYDPSNVTLVQQKQELLTQSVQKTQEKLNTLKEAQAQVQEQFDKGEITAEQYRDFQREIAATEGKLKSYTSQLEEVTTKHKTLRDTLEETSQKLKDVGDKSIDMGKDLSKKVTVPLVAAGGVSLKAASDFESAFAGVRKTVDATEDEFKALEDGIRSMAKEIPASANEISAVAESAGQLGIQNENILDFTRTIIDLSQATDLGLEQGATQFARFANIVGMSQTEFSRLGSVVVGLGNNFATTESEVVDLGMRLAAQGKQIGLTESEIMALSATMSSLGLSAEAGGTAMSTVMKKIAVAVDEGGKSTKAFADIAGVSASEFSEAFKNEPIKAIDMFVKGLDKSSKEGGNLTTILGDLGIKGIRETDTLLRMAGASDLLSEAVGLASNAWDENTALTEEANQRYATFESKMSVLKNTLVDVGIDIGNILLPVILSLVEKIQGAIEWFSGLSEGMKTTIVVIGGILAAVGPVLIIFGKMATGLGAIIDIGLKLQPVFLAIKTAVAAAGVSISAIAAPIAIAIAAIVAIIAIIKNWSAISEFAKNVWNSFIEWFTVTFEAFKEWVSNLFSAIGEFISNAVTAVVDFVIGYFEFLYTTWSNILNNIYTFVSGLFTSIKNAVINVITTLVTGAINLFKNMASNLINAITSLPTKIKDLFTKVKNFIVNPLKSINLLSIGKDIMMGLVRGITNSISAVTNVVKNVASSIAGGFKKFFGIKSPSRLMRDVVGKMIPQGIAVGVEADTDEALDAVDDMNRQIMMASEPDMMSLMRGQSISNVDPAQQATISIGSKLDRLVAVFDETLTKLSNPNYQMVLDTGVIVGEMKNEMDQALGNNQKMKGRGRE